MLCYGTRACRKATGYRVVLGAVVSIVSIALVVQADIDSNETPPAVGTETTLETPNTGDMWIRRGASLPKPPPSESRPGASGTRETRDPADYQWDDGSAENSIGVNDGAAGSAFGWANRFTNVTGSSITLVDIEIAFGSPGGAAGVAIGDAVDGLIWVDAAATGNMVNATKMAQWSLPGGVHANDGATFATHIIPGGGVAIPAGADFYVGLGDIQTANDSIMRYPAAIDEGPSAGMSWAFFDPNNNVFDPDNLAGQTIDLIDNFGLPGNWLIRANAEAEMQPLGLPANTVHHARKHRYISIDPSTNDPEPVAIKVEIADMRRCTGDMRRACLGDADCRKVCDNDPDIVCVDSAQCGAGTCIPTGPCTDHPDVGLSWWVQEPQLPPGCPWPDGPPCGPEDWTARLDPAVYVSDWGASQTLHIGDCETVPNVTYNVYACDPSDLSSCSAPLVVPTQVMPYGAPGTRADYGDVAGSITPALEFSPPDGFLNLSDVTASLLTLRNWGTSNLPQAHPTWVDLGGCGLGSPPDYLLFEEEDLNVMLDGMLGYPWTRNPRHIDPGHCQDDVLAPPPCLQRDWEHRAKKHRYLSIDVTTNSPDTVAWKVELVEYKRCEGDLEEACAENSDCGPGGVNGPCVNTHPAVGSTWWVQEPQENLLGCRQRCHTFTGDFCYTDTDCLPPDIGSCAKRCGATDQFARLDATPHFSNWTDPRFPLTTLHIGDCEVVPVAIYEIRACLPPDAVVCGEPLVIGTVPQSRTGGGTQNYGDIASAPKLADDPYGPPDGITNVSDVQGYINTVVNFPGPNIKQLHMTWVDVWGAGIGTPPDYYRIVTDLLVFKQAWDLDSTWAGGHTDNGNPNECPP